MQFSRSRSVFASALIVGFTFFGIVSTAQATPVVTPVGIGSGDSYRLIFRTSIGRDATSTDISDYNAFVTSVANAVTELAALGTTWSAIASTSTVDARDNTGTNPTTDGAGVPIYLLNGTTKIADDYADFWDGSIDSFLNVNENGALQTGNSVWSGSNGDGTAATYAHLGTIYSYGHAGLPNATNSGWIAASAPILTTELTFFAISGVLPAEPTAVFAPGGGIFIGLGFAGLALARRKRAV